MNAQLLQIVFDIGLAAGLSQCIFTLTAKTFGHRSLKYNLFFLSPSAWMPAVWVNTFSPTTGLLEGMRIPEKVSTSLLTRYIDASFTDVFTPGRKSFSTAIALASGALPALSPIPLTVRCIP